MDIRFSEQQKGILGVSGHVGVGHVHSHSGFVQDDSAGLAVAARILKQALPVGRNSYRDDERRRSGFGRSPPRDRSL